MWKLKNAFKRFFTDHAAKEAIEASKETQKHVNLFLNGEDRYFLKVCDSRDPEEKECPPEYIEQ